MMLSEASSNMVHSFSTFVRRFLSGRCRKDFDLMACAKSFAAVVICSSEVILGQLNLLHSDQWNVLTMLDFRVLGLNTVKHL